MSDWPWGWHLDVDFDTPPSQQPVSWTSLSSPETRETRRIRDSLSWSYGRPSVLQGGQAGSGTIVLNNSDRLVDPTNTSSPHHGRLLPFRHFRLQSEVNGKLWPTAAGFVKGWPQVPVDNGLQQVTPLPVADGFAWLGQRPRVDVDLPRQRSGVRVHALLDAAGWPSGLRDIEDGVVLVDAVQAEGVSPLDALRDVEEAEDGRLFCAPDGKVTFHSRHHRLRVQGATSVYLSTYPSTYGGWVQGVLGVDGHPMVDLLLAGADTAGLVNSARVERSDGDVFEVVDADSVAEFGEQQRTWRDVAMSAVECDALAEWWVQRFAWPQARVERLVLSGRTGALGSMVHLGVGGVVRVTRAPAVGGPSLDLWGVVDHVSHAAGQGTWETDYRLSSYHGDGVWALWDDDSRVWDTALAMP